MLKVGDKSATKSITVIGAAIFAGVQAAEGLDLVPAGTAAELAAIAKSIGILMAAYGARRAIGENGAPAFFDGVEEFAQDPGDES